MSLNKFSELFSDLDSNNSTNNKIRLLSEYFLSNDPQENVWTIYLLTGKSNKRFISGKKLRTIFSEFYNLPIWLTEVCYAKVGDSAEVISLLLKEHIENKENKLKEISINKLMKEILPDLNNLNDQKKFLKIKYIWENIPYNNHLIFNKILTGTFRIGVSKGLVTKSIAKMINVDESIISHRLMGELNPTLETYQFLINKNLQLSELNYKPYPFQLAKTFEEKIKKSSIDNFQLEWKWDGIRSQIIKRLGKISIWSRGEELINNSFPELLPIISELKDDFVLDGEILVWDESQNLPRDFSFLQKRLGRKSPSTKIQKTLAIIFIAYDILEINKRDIRDYPLKERRIILEERFIEWEKNNKDIFSKKFKITILHKAENWNEVENIKNLSRQNNTEGLVIKNKNSKYLSGRKSGHWWKYKVDPMQLDAVLIYAKGGSGRRAGLYTDYSFGLWDEDRLVKFTSAYSGLSNHEIKELDKWIRKNTIERFGPVRSVKPEMVFEISFENIQISKRHKSGIAVRFPRISRWRRDKKINDADHIKTAYKLMQNI